jgi:hypothetical protein
MFLFVVKVYTSQHVSEIWGWKDNKYIHSHITKLSRVRVEGTYDCIHFR